MIIIRIISSFFASLGFGILFNAPKSELIISGVIGALGWSVFEITSLFFNDTLLPIFLAIVTITLFSRIFESRRNMLITVYLVLGIISFVPGAGIYYTMYHLIYTDTEQAVIFGIETLKVSGTIAIGIITVLSIPKNIFLVFSKKSESKNT